ncbi:hypothetical protein BpHYR1_039950 [Brachionus plicatilis]|uniref:Uncharacterized protein n=1 Tax=Brachionus plicatilis TaxID=10195 RepID=A0A3M7PAX2_BRAPC|nr:hypothetical protein BpHYR1_039950 [Brachionus plicatilis]
MVIFPWHLSKTCSLSAILQNSHRSYRPPQKFWMKFHTYLIVHALWLKACADRRKCPRAQLLVLFCEIQFKFRDKDIVQLSKLHQLSRSAKLCKFSINKISMCSIAVDFAKILHIVWFNILRLKLNKDHKSLKVS